MTRLAFVLATTLLSACARVTPQIPGLPAADHEPDLADSSASGRGLQPFASMDDLRRRMAAVLEARRLAREKERDRWRAQCRESFKSDVDIEIICGSGIVETQMVLAAGTALRSITNNQHEGVDEGDIVKRQGDMLIVLRRGRLFTLAIGGGQLDSLTIADAFGPSGEIDPQGTWYDELLVWQRTVIVIGYSYERGGTEIGLFDLGDHGELEYRATYHVRSDDYYSGTNYASRLIGDRLLLFSSLGVPDDADPDAWLPSLRRWGPRGSDAPFETIAPINQIFQPVAPLGAYPGVHSLISCNLAAYSLDCTATVVVGDPFTEYYASPTAAYVWTTAWRDDGASLRSTLYRIPYDGSRVSAIGVTGRPPDQLAFFEDEREHLNVVVAHDNEAVTLLRLPLSSFSDGSITAPAWYYRPITSGYWVTARFVGPYVLASTGALDSGDPHGRRVVITTFEGTSTVSLKLPHTVERIEPMGAHAVVVGADNKRLLMTSIRLANRPTVASTLMLKDMEQSEYRTHAFFYRQDARENGVFGLPVAVTHDGADDNRWDRPARIVFIQNRGLTLAFSGTLSPAATKPIDDGCRASCLDWYGNARPIFIDNRVFALSGYDIVEGRFMNGRMEQVGQLNFMPAREPLIQPTH